MLTVHAAEPAALDTVIVNACVPGSSAGSWDVWVGALSSLDPEGSLKGPATGVASSVTDAVVGAFVVVHESVTESPTGIEGRDATITHIGDLATPGLSTAEARTKIVGNGAASVAKRTKRAAQTFLSFFPFATIFDPIV